MTTSARDLDILLAGSIRTLALMTISSARMTAHFPRSTTTLNAHLSWLFAAVRMTQSDALVSTTRQGLTAWQTTRHFVQIAGNCFSELMPTVAPLLRENCAGWTVGLAVTIMKDFVAAGVLTGARTSAGRSSCAAGNWWIDNRSSTLAEELLKAASVAGVTSAFMTGELALVAAAVEGLGAG